MNGRSAGIMQPYFLPYLGYWQLIAAVDRFVVYDNIQYTKKGWINRNRYLRDGEVVPFTLPLARASSSAQIGQRFLADDFDEAADKLLRRVAEAYRGAPQRDQGMALLEQCLRCGERNLFDLLLHSIRRVAGLLGLGTPILPSSEIAVDHTLKAQDRVLAICHALGATVYVNPEGGRALYDASDFAAAGIELRFLECRHPSYPQGTREFVPALSILDLLMWKSPQEIRDEGILQACRLRA